MDTHVNNGHQINGQFAALLVCPNGHGSAPDGSKFCIRCGVQLVAWQAATPQPVQPIVPPIKPPIQPIKPIAPIVLPSPVENPQDNSSQSFNRGLSEDDIAALEELIVRDDLKL